MKKIIKDESLSFYGYNPIIALTIPNKDCLIFGQYLKGLLDSASYISKQTYLPVDEAIKSSKSFLTSYFAIQNIRMIFDGTVSKAKEALNNANGYYEVQSVIKRFIQIVSPFDLPIMPSSIGGAKSYMLKDPKQECDLTNYPLEKNNNIIYSSILINYNTQFTMPFEYTHEITHTQVDGHIGSVRNYCHSEVLSIFLESLHAYLTGPDDYQIMNRMRLQNLLFVLKKYTKGITDLETILYIESTIIAEILIDIYISNPLIRPFIINTIQNIFLGYDHLENLLGKLGITIEGEEKYIAIKRNLSR